MPQHRAAVRAVFAAVALICAVQYVVSSRLGEPYPAIAMPPFAESGGYRDGRVHVTSFDAIFVTADGAAIAFTPREFLGEFPDSHHATIARQFLSPLPEPSRSPTAPASRRGLRYVVFPGLRAGMVDRTAHGNIDSLRAWAQRRARALLGGRIVERIECRWYEDIRGFARERLMRERQPRGVFIIRLAGTP